MPRQQQRPASRDRHVRPSSSDRRGQKVAAELQLATTARSDRDLRLTTSASSKRLDDDVSNGSLSPTHLRNDEELLTWLVRLRLLSVDQIQRLLFRNQHQAVVSRALKRLRERRCISTWDESRGRGGRRRYALPTASGMRLGVEAIRLETAGTQLERLATSMLPSFDRRPLELPTRATPPFLPHQRECNHLAISFIAAGATLWASTWDRPFAPSVGGLAMPQPDAVLVVRTSSRPKLIFVEHDRGQESLAHFERAKVQRYVQLARAPQFCEDLFGFTEFMVAVTIADVAKRRPLARLKALSDFVGGRGASALFAFTLAGWVHTDPLGAVWFTHGTKPSASELRPDAHRGTGPLLDSFGSMSRGQGSTAELPAPAPAVCDDVASVHDASTMLATPSARFNDSAQHRSEHLHNPSR